MPFFAAIAELRLDGAAHDIEDLAGGPHHSLLERTAPEGNDIRRSP